MLLGRPHLDERRDTTVIKFRVGGQLKAEIQSREALNPNLNRSLLIRQALAEYFERHPAEATTASSRR